MRVLLIGNGGREHAIAWSLRCSDQVEEIFCNTKNPGIAQLATPIELESAGIVELAKWAKNNRIDLTVVGPEAPLSIGIVDVFKEMGLTIFGPSKGAARIESSKVYAKDLMKEYKIPTAEYVVCHTYQEAVKQLHKIGAPIVVKADGLAGGKGAVVCKSYQEAEDALQLILSQRVFGEAGDKVVLEEYLEGEEVSILAFCDGKNFIPMVPSQDHKAAFDDDKGPNTGGMGAYSPVHIVTDELLTAIKEEILLPTMVALSQEGYPYTGVLYAGLMITSKGPKVIEFNCRFGDPETQCVLPRLKSDLAKVMLSCVEGRLSEVDLLWDERSCVCVIIASGGYPGPYKTGYPITGLDRVAGQSDLLVFHAGTKKVGEQIVTDGGRVLGISALAPTTEEAVHKAYQAVREIEFTDFYYRKDIAHRALDAREHWTRPR